MATSSDASCFNASQLQSPDFVFSIEPPNQIVQCVSTRIWWENSTVQGYASLEFLISILQVYEHELVAFAHRTPNFLGVIPGGQSFAVPESNITNVQSEGTGFSWVPSIRAGTTLILVGGDNRGNGSAGSTTNLVSAGFQNDISCLSNASPSSTAGNPAGGTYPTSARFVVSFFSIFASFSETRFLSSAGGSSTSQSSGGSNVGAIVGGVLGSVAFIVACVALFWIFRRRLRKSHKRTKKLPTDILDADDDEDVPRAVGQNELPQNYQPEPFMVPIPESTPSEFDDEFSNSRPFSPGTRTSFYTRSSTPDMASTMGLNPGVVNGDSSIGRKGGAPRPMRAVNIIQHHDAGPNNGEREEEPVETIELPPAYTMVRRAGGSGGDDGDGPSTSANT